MTEIQNPKPYDLGERTLKFAEKARNYVKKLPKTTANLEAMKELIRKGESYPGANYVIRIDGRRKKITEELKEEICAEIQPGYKIERHN